MSQRDPQKQIRDLQQTVRVLEHIILENGNTLWEIQELLGIDHVRPESREDKRRHVRTWRPKAEIRHLILKEIRRLKKLEPR
jgi:hypothetical protein